MRSALSPLFFAAALALLAAGCQESQPVRHARTTQTLVLSPDKPSPDVEVEVVTNVEIVLPGPEPGSGLEWEIVANNIKCLDQTSALKTAPAAPGAAPTTTVTYYALRPGKSILRFVLVRPNESVAVPAAKCSVVVRVVD